MLNREAADRADLSESARTPRPAGRLYSAFDLHLVRRRRADSELAQRRLDSHRLVVVALEHAHHAARFDAGLVQKTQKLRIALEEAGDGVARPLSNVGQSAHTTFNPLVRGLRKNRIAMGAGSFFAE